MTLDEALDLAEIDTVSRSWRDAIEENGRLAAEAKKANG